MLPEGWERKTVADICILQNGNGFKPHQWDTKGLPIIRIQNLNGSSNFNYFSGNPLEKWLVNPGQILFAWAGSKGVSFGPFIWNGPQGVLNQHIFKVFSKDKIDNNWLYLILRSITDKIEGQAHGFKATLVHVKKQDIDNQIVNIPPLPEQKKIAAILSTWDRAIEGTEKLLANSQQQKKALMQQLLTGKKRLPGFTGEWKHTSLKSCCACLDNKRVPLNSDERQEMSGDIPYWGANAVVDHINKYIFNETIVLIAEDGGYFSEYRDRPIAQISYGKSWVNNHAHILTAKSEICIDEWVYYCLVHKDITAFVNGGTRAKLNKEHMLQIKIPLPDIKEQRELVSVLSTADEEITALESDLLRLRQEKKALMQQLLTGKRRVTVD
ncbi:MULTISPECIES: restriction endonuclease subunit S [unclassified Acetobacter]|uniref:restriction endonuclease subunit S n=1 Tax=unclassified Acetobacter TaxID=2628570 RepID=UPI0012380114|nr:MULTISPECIES: restriction endonuclease subunit S [unclassified Acetobacter]KAA8396044.1 restriction endonuclease subunit S [Acetobacter sp. DmW_125128]KAA8396797.1 restriction endonuclease subunit S [Acetobacter sp. DmW_125124]KAA8400237.1 restriction endonuclease subunit S [Acetobacter sp. DmW_125127]KAA8402081.1 restriction endonuclease subunit S [Acetobacter sp. DmW_125133]KAA8405291.1 restriction endonuclease subunit S [Acetobacter sp. DmW_125132]